MKKEKHPVYRLIMGILFFFLLLGGLLLFMGLRLGGDRLILPSGVSL